METNQLRFYHALTNFWIYALPLPKNNADFRGAFKSYLAQSESTNALIENISRTRTDVVNLVGSNAPLEQRIKAVDDYLPHLYLLYESIVAHQGGAGLKADKELVFEWRCYLAPNNLPHFKSSDLVFEIMMTLHLKASLHYFLARHLLDLDLISSLTEAGKQLVTASGVLDYIEANIRSNKWNRPHYSAPSIPNPAETSAAVIAGLSLYYRSLAQILAIVKGAANTEKPTPLSVKTRLSVAVINMSANALKSLEAGSFGGTGKFSNWLNFDLLTKVAVNREVFTALTYFYQSKALTEKQEIGVAIAYAQFAQLHLAEQSGSKYNYTAAGLPKSQGNFANLVSVTSYLRSLLSESITENDRTNRFVTFQVVPKTIAELPALPAEAVIMNSTSFKEPVIEDKALVLFLLPEKKSFFGSLFSASKSKSKSEGDVAPAKSEEGADAKKAAGDVAEVSSATAPSPAIQGQVVYMAPSSPGPPSSPTAVTYANQPAPAPSLNYVPNQLYTQPYAQPPQPQPQFPPSSANAINYPSNNNLYPALSPYSNTQNTSLPPPQPQYNQQPAYNYQPTHTNPPAPGSAPAPAVLYYNPNPSAPPTTTMSDEEYARQLQQQYNEEAKK
eukprot:gene15152-16915_t